MFWNNERKIMGRLAGRWKAGYRKWELLNHCTFPCSPFLLLFICMIDSVTTMAPHQLFDKIISKLILHFLTLYREVFKEGESLCEWYLLIKRQVVYVFFGLAWEILNLRFSLQRYWQIYLHKIILKRVTRFVRDLRLTLSDRRTEMSNDPSCRW